MYDRLLVPTDGSAEMARVVDHAGELARAHGATLHGLYVVDVASTSTLPMDASLDSLHGMLQEEGSAALDDFERMAPADVDTERTVVEGTPPREIVDRTLEADCDAIVMGTHGRGGLDRLLLGSVAERVRRRSPVPVITVPVTGGTKTETTAGEPVLR